VSRVALVAALIARFKDTILQRAVPGVELELCVKNTSDRAWESTSNRLTGC
jgi:hypothetical protein